MAIIGTIRKHAGLAVALIGIAIIGFVIQDAFGGRGQSAPPVAVIDGESISYDLFSMQVDQLTDQYIQSQGGNVSLTDADREQIRNIAWQRMLSDLLMNNACTETGLQVSPDELSYDVSYKKQPLVSKSQLGFEFDNGTFSSNLKVGKISRKEINETYELVVGKVRIARNHCNELIVPLTEKSSSTKTPIFSSPNGSF